MISPRPVIPELLAPAGSFEKLVTAVHYGADAVYLSGKKYGLRAKAANFEEPEIREAVAYAHRRGVKVYVTVNIIAHDDDFAGLDDYLAMLQEADVDAVIVSDPGIVQLARSVAVDLPIHLSTQANVTNRHAAAFWVGQGVSRLNLARELSLAEIQKIREQVDAELEVFVHGAVCISYSGRCMLSTYLTGRDANRGNCAHPCRYSYALVEEKRPGEYFPVVEDDRGTYIFNAKDLCQLQNLPYLVASGVDSLKIEGRMKSIFYVGGVVRIYRAALDYLKSLAPSEWRALDRITMPHRFIEEIEKTGTRGMSPNFAHQRPGAEDMIYRSSRFAQEYEPVAVVKELPLDRTGVAVELRNLCRIGEQVEYMDRSIEVRSCLITEMQDLDGNSIERGNPGDRVIWLLDRPETDFAANSMFRRKKSDHGAR